MAADYDYEVFPQDLSEDEFQAYLDQAYQDDEFNAYFDQVGEPTMSSEVLSCSRQILGSGAFNPLFYMLGLSFLQAFIASGESFPREVPLLTSLCGGAWLAWLHFGPAVLLRLAGLVALCWALRTVSRSLVELPTLLKATVPFGYILIAQSQLAPEEWMRLRGPLMVLAMKLVSLETAGHDPSTLEFAAYSFDVSTVMFGPWIPFLDFLALQNSAFGGLTLFRLKRILFSLVGAFGFLLVGDCLLPTLIPDDYEAISIWLIGYRDAAAFRFGQYFACFLGQASLLLAGFDPEFSAVSPLKLEAPRSLVTAVVGWNKPMHRWLKIIVYQPVSIGTESVGLGLLATYLTSSLLHGVNFQISAVLISLALFTYSEEVLRRRLAALLSACVGARKCRECTHRKGPRSPLAIALNAAFGLLAVGQLLYLGMVFGAAESQFEGYDRRHTIAVWQGVGFAGHIVGAVLFCLANTL